MLAKIELLSVEALAETGDKVLLEATIRSALGQARVYNAVVIRNGKVTHHFTGVR
jgi:hypothetical protein